MSETWLILNARSLVAFLCLEIVKCVCMRTVRIGGLRETVCGYLIAEVFHAAKMMPVTSSASGREMKMSILQESMRIIVKD